MKNLLVIKTLFLAGALAFTGCSQEKSKTVMETDPSRWIRVDDAAVAEAKPEETPAINPETFLATGRLMESQGNLVQAAGAYHQACQARPNYVVAWNRLGIICDKLGQYDQAEHAFKQAIRHAPKAAFLHNNLGFSCLLAGKYEEAEEHLHNALQLNGQFQRARVNLAIALGKRDQFDQALTEFKKALPEAQAYYNLAYVHRLNHNWQQAGDCYKQALEIDPDLSEAQTGLALCNQQSCNPSDIENLETSEATIVIQDTSEDK
jgi:tetratricopeptide (TPR) repeat protein